MRIRITGIFEVDDYDDFMIDLTEMGLETMEHEEELEDEMSDG